MALQNMNIKEGMVTRARHSSGDPTLYCDKCSYKCNLKHQMNTHKISKHGVQVKPLKITAAKRKSPPNKSPENKRTTKGKVTFANDSKEVLLTESKEDSSQKTFICAECTFRYTSNNDLACHMSVMHATIIPPPGEVHLKVQAVVDSAKKEQTILEPPVQVLVEQERQVIKQATPPVTKEKLDTVESRPITRDEVESILTNIAKEESRKNIHEEIKEFLDIEKERLQMEAENWRKTAQDLDLDLKSAQKSNEKLIKDQLVIKEDYEKVAQVAGALQNKVHNLEEEVKEMKVKLDLDIKAKDKAEIELETLKSD